MCIFAKLNGCSGEVVCLAKNEMCQTMQVKSKQASFLHLEACRVAPFSAFDCNVAQENGLFFTDCLSTKVLSVLSLLDRT